MNPPVFAFPLEVVTVPIGDLTLQIRCLRSRDMFASATVVTQRDLYAYVLWESAVGLSNRLAAETSLTVGKRVLELGAGVGLPGLVAQALGGQVTQTDYQVDSLTLCQWNAQQNGLQTNIFQGDWRQWSHAPRYDLIIAADILYETALHYYIERIFHRNLMPGGTIWLADPGRPQALDFVVHLEEHGWQVTIETHSIVPRLSGDPNPLTPSRDGAVEVTLFQLTRGKGVNAG
ncbi:MAG: methyltransferase domain-containing protein [Caldilineaceae bacterium]